jgi:hypothetical protein
METVGSQLRRMGIQPLRARTNQSFSAKYLLAFALICANLD